MSDFLQTMLTVKQDEVNALKKRRNSLQGRTQPQRPFLGSILSAGIDTAGVWSPLALIAEIKKASPSKGNIRPDLNVLTQAKTYQAAGVQAVSVLTEEHYFKGAISDLVSVQQAINIPILRKDFIIDPLQILESASINADAVLLIAAMLSQGQLQELFAAAQENGLDALVEIHSLPELEQVLTLPLKILGINNRNLSSLAVDNNTLAAIMPHVPKEIAVVAESGIKTPADARTFQRSGVRGLLVGEALVTAADPASLIKELRCVDSY